MPFEEHRTFRRYALSSECQIRQENEVFTGRVIDYSLSGASVLFGTAVPLVKGTKAFITIHSTDMSYQCEVVWTRESPEGYKVGVQRVSELTGSLADFSLADALIGLQKTTKTGILKILSGSIMKSIYIQNGDMIFASSNDKEDRLGEMLLKEGNISLEQFYQTSEIIRKSGERLGNILVDLGLKPNTVFQAVKRQIETIILSIFNFHDGIFEFYEGPLPTDELITLKVSAANIIHRGMKRLDSFTILNRITPPLDSVLIFSLNPFNIFQDITLDEPDKKILSLINGKNSLKTILSLSPYREFETLKIVCSILITGLIRIKSADEPAVQVPLEELISEPTSSLTEEFVHKAESLYSRLNDLGNHELLGVNKQASYDYITLAYYRLSKEFHPDRHFSLPSHDIKEKLMQIVSSITASYHALSDLMGKPGYTDKNGPSSPDVSGKYSTEGTDPEYTASGHESGSDMHDLRSGDIEFEEISLEKIPPEDRHDN